MGLSVCLSVSMSVCPVFSCGKVVALFSCFLVSMMQIETWRSTSSTLFAKVSMRAIDEPLSGLFAVIVLLSVVGVLFTYWYMPTIIVCPPPVCTSSTRRCGDEGHRVGNVDAALRLGRQGRVADRRKRPRDGGYVHQALQRLFPPRGGGQLWVSYVDRLLAFFVFVPTFAQQYLVAPCVHPLRSPPPFLLLLSFSLSRVKGARGAMCACSRSQ